MRSACRRRRGGDCCQRRCGVAGRDAGSGDRIVSVGSAGLLGLMDPLHRFFAEARLGQKLVTETGEAACPVSRGLRRMYGAGMFGERMFGRDDVANG